MYQNKMTLGVESSVQQNIDSLTSLVKEHRNDTEFRSRITSEPREILNEIGFNIPETIDINVVADTRDLLHVTFPSDPNAAISDEMLSLVSAGQFKAGDPVPTSTLASLITCLSSVAIWELD